MVFNLFFNLSIYISLIFINPQVLSISASLKAFCDDYCTRLSINNQELASWVIGVNSTKCGAKIFLVDFQFGDFKMMKDHLEQQ